MAPGAAKVAALLAARHADSFAVLGPHRTPEGTVVRALVPGAERLLVEGGGASVELERRHHDGVFEGLIAEDPGAYRLHAFGHGAEWTIEDAYRFGPVLGPLDDHHPGKKLLFVGKEFGQPGEWNFRSELDWHLLGHPLHAGPRDAVRALKQLHRSLPALHARDCEAEGFRWIVADDADQPVLAWLRFGGSGDAPVAAVSSFTPVPRHGHRIASPPRAPGARSSTRTLATMAARHGQFRRGRRRAASEPRLPRFRRKHGPPACDPVSQARSAMKPAPRCAVFVP